MEITEKMDELSVTVDELVKALNVSLQSLEKNFNKGSEKINVALDKVGKDLGNSVIGKLHKKIQEFTKSLEDKKQEEIYKKKQEQVKKDNNNKYNLQVNKADKDPFKAEKGDGLFKSGAKAFSKLNILVSELHKPLLDLVGKLNNFLEVITKPTEKLIKGLNSLIPSLDTLILSITLSILALSMTVMNVLTTLQADVIEVLTVMKDAIVSLKTLINETVKSLMDVIYEVVDFAMTAAYDLMALIEETVNYIVAKIDDLTGAFYEIIDHVKGITLPLVDSLLKILSFLALYIVTKTLPEISKLVEGVRETLKIVDKVLEAIFFVMHALFGIPGLILWGLKKIWSALDFFGGDDEEEKIEGPTGFDVGMTAMKDKMEALGNSFTTISEKTNELIGPSVPILPTLPSGAIPSSDNNIYIEVNAPGGDEERIKNGVTEAIGQVINMDTIHITARNYSSPITT